MKQSATKLIYRIEAAVFALLHHVDELLRRQESVPCAKMQLQQLENRRVAPEIASIHPPSSSNRANRISIWRGVTKSALFSLCKTARVARKNCSIPSGHSARQLLIHKVRQQSFGDLLLSSPRSAMIRLTATFISSRCSKNTLKFMNSCSEMWPCNEHKAG